MVGQAKAAKQQAGGDQQGGQQVAQGGNADGANAPDGGKAADGAGNGDAPKENAIDKFVQMLDGAKSINDIKNIREQALANVPDDQKENAEKKLNLAILKKLGIGEPGPDGSMQVKLTPEVEKVLGQLGMKPDEIQDAGAGDAAGPIAAQDGKKTQAA